MTINSCFYFLFFFCVVSVKKSLYVSHLLVASDERMNISIKMQGKAEANIMCCYELLALGLNLAAVKALRAVHYCFVI